MRRERARLLAVLAVLAVLAGLAPAPAAIAADRDGRWRIPGNPYRSRVELSISGTQFMAHVGCTSIGLERDADGRQIGPFGAIVHGAPCFERERRSPAADAYWDGIIEHLIDMRSAEVEAGRLIVRRADGRTMVFVRSREP